MAGRPSKKDLAATTAVAKKPGPKPGQATIMAEYRQRMLASPKSRKVLDKIMDSALDDEHRHQAVAWKILADRLLPLSAFDPKKGNHGGVSISINVTPVDAGAAVDAGGVVIEGETIPEEE